MQKNNQSYSKKSMYTGYTVHFVIGKDNEAKYNFRFKNPIEEGWCDIDVQ